MVFKILVKQKIGMGHLPTNVVCVNKATISLGRDFKDLFHRKNFLEVYTDEDNKMLGLKPSDSKERGFPIRWNEANQPRGQVSLNLQKKVNVKSGQVFKAEVIKGMIICKEVIFSEEEKVEEKVESNEVAEDNIDFNLY